MTISGITITGLDQAIAEVERIRDTAQSRDINRILLEFARTVRDEARRRAPVYTGNLKRSIAAFTRGTRWRKAAIAWVQNRDKDGRPGAPHAHLVSFGGRGGAMPANPYWEDAVNAVREQAGAKVVADLEALFTSTGYGRRTFGTR